MHIVPVYAALLGLLFVVLSIRTLRLRRRLRIAVGSAGSDDMLRAMRVHANFSEYVPLILVLLYFMEIRGANSLLMHVLCAGLLVGRLSHAFGVSQPDEKFAYRVFGIAMTLTSLSVACLFLLVSGFTP